MSNISYVAFITKTLVARLGCQRAVLCMCIRKAAF